MTSVAGANRRRRSLWVSLIVMLVLAFGPLIAVISAGWTPRLGLDLAGGLEIVLQPAKGYKITAAQANVAVDIIRNRVDHLGVSGATVQTQGSQIVVQVPGVKNGRAIGNAIGQTAQLYFRPVQCFANDYVAPTKVQKHYSALKIPPCNPEFALNATSIDVQVNNSAAGFTSSNPGPDPTFNNVPSVNPIYDKPSVAIVAPGLPGGGPAQDGTGRYVLGPAVMNGTAVGSASVTQDTTGQWIVQCTLTSKGSAEWDHWSYVYFHQYMGIELDGVVQSAPLILPQAASWTSFQGNVQISGNLTQADANTLANALEYGSLPVPLVVLTSESISPTLGHAALVAGLGAGLAGLLLVLLYVIFYYRMLGLVVVTGLAVTAALLWSIISALGQTTAAPSFDLAGVTGLIVSIGITTDSYIVYFERLKDETRAGRSVRTSLDRGFASAWRTVLAADTVSLLAAVLLYFLATSSVRGFAFFLGLSTLLDIIVTWFFTRPAVALLGRNERLSSMRRFGIGSGLLATPAQTQQHPRPGPKVVQPA